MDLYQAFLAAVMIAGLSGLIFVGGALVSDLFISWITSRWRYRWRYRCRRVQARYRNKR